LLRDDIGFVVDPGGPHPVRFPDLAFVPAARWARLAVVDPAAGPGLPPRPTAGDPYASGYPLGAPDLPVEVARQDAFLAGVRHASAGRAGPQGGLPGGEARGGPRLLPGRRAAGVVDRPAPPRAAGAGGGVDGGRPGAGAAGDRRTGGRPGAARVPDPAGGAVA